MAGIKKSGVSTVYYASAALFLILMTLGAEVKSVQSQSCLQDITNLNVCAPFVLPGQGVASPSAECCSALQRVDQGCICNTLRIAARIPSACSLPALTCGNTPVQAGTWKMGYSTASTSEKESRLGVASTDESKLGVASTVEKESKLGVASTVESKLGVASAVEKESKLGVYP